MAGKEIVSNSTFEVIAEMSKYYGDSISEKEQVWATDEVVSLMTKAQTRDSIRPTDAWFLILPAKDGAPAVILNQDTQVRVYVYDDQIVYKHDNLSGTGGHDVSRYSIKVKAVNGDYVEIMDRLDYDDVLVSVQRAQGGIPRWYIEDDYLLEPLGCMCIAGGEFIDMTGKNRENFKFGGNRDIFSPKGLLYETIANGRWK